MSNIINNETKKGETKILRPLGYNEIYLDIMCKNDCWVGTSCTIVDSKLDLYSNIDRLNQAVEQWSFFQPFLRSRIVNADDYNKVEKKFNFKRYFALVEDNLKFDNVTYLSFNSTNIISDNDCNKVCEFFVNYETNKPLAPKNELLWRLTFIKFKRSESYRYGIYFRINHVISEGKNVGALWVQLLNTIDDCYQSKVINKINKSESFTQSLETYLYNNDDKIIDKIDIDEHTMKLYKYVSKPPDRFIPDQCETTGTILSSLPGSFRTYKNETTDYFDSDIKLYAVFTTQVYDNSVLQKMVKECSFYKTKPIGFFSTLMSLALYRTYKEYSAEHLIDNGILYSTTVSLKQHLDIGLDDFDMGYFIAPILESFEPPFIDINDPDFKEKFWKRVVFESNRIHSIIKSKNIKEFPKLRKSWLTNYPANIINRSNDYSMFNQHFTIASYGNLSSSDTIFSTENNFNFVRTLMSTSHGTYMPPLIIINCLTNLENLEFHISYSRRKTSDKIIESLKKHATLILEKAIESYNVSKL